MSKEKFLKDSKIKDVMYHGTNSADENVGIKKFEPSHRGMHFATPSKDFANDYAYSGTSQVVAPGAVYPVHVHAKRPFDYENEAHRENLIDKMWPRQENQSDFDVRQDMRRRLQSGDWGYMERPDVIEAAKKLDHDAMFMKEGGAKNIGVFNPEQFKSATGNQGTYDMSDPDITKSRGGKVSIEQMKAELSAKMKPKPVRKATGGDIEGAQHDTEQEGPFYRVRPKFIEKGSARPVGLLESSGEDTGITKGSPRDTHSEPYSDEQIKGQIKAGNTFAHQAAQDYNQKYLGYPHQVIPNLPSSHQKQNPIGKAFELAAAHHPEYKKRVYEQWKHHLPEHVGEAKDYDELMDKAYGKLGEETHAQFNSLPINMSFHRNGEGNYTSSNQMRNDVHNNRHMYVYQGGDPHEHLHKIDPHTGLSQNDMFRAVRDFYGHAMNGSEFGPHGEEKAWAEHSGMFSPLARIALSGETRGQNSLVNYTGLNSELKKEVAKQREAQAEAKRRGMEEQAEKHGKNIKDFMEHFQFAPQKSVLLPPEMVSGRYNGEIPHYLRDLIKTEEEK